MISFISDDDLRALIRAVAEGENCVESFRSKLEKTRVGKTQLQYLEMNAVVLRTDMHGCVWHWFRDLDSAKKLVTDAYNACINDPTFAECFLSKDQTVAWMIRRNSNRFESPTVEFRAECIFE